MTEGHENGETDALAVCKKAMLVATPRMARAVQQRTSRLSSAIVTQ
jgi:hypothetical protein